MTSIQMPQLGETIVEGTILKWLKQEGDAVAADEPLFEISTDKVDTEVPSPVAGTVTKLLVAEGATVPVGTAVMEIDDGTGAGAGVGSDGGGAAGGSTGPDTSSAAAAAPVGPPPTAPVSAAQRRTGAAGCAAAPLRAVAVGAESGGGGGSGASVADLVSDRATVGEGARDRSGDRGRVR